MEVRVWSYGDADNRPEWDYKVGEWVEIIRSGEILATGRISAITGYGKTYHVTVEGVGVYKLSPGELRKIP